MEEPLIRNMVLEVVATAVKIRLLLEQLKVGFLSLERKAVLVQMCGSQEVQVEMNSTSIRGTYNPVQYGGGGCPGGAGGGWWRCGGPPSPGSSN